MWPQAFAYPRDSRYLVPLMTTFAPWSASLAAMRASLLVFESNPPLKLLRTSVANMWRRDNATMFHVHGVRDKVERIAMRCKVALHVQHARHGLHAKDLQSLGSQLLDMLFQ